MLTNALLPHPDETMALGILSILKNRVFRLNNLRESLNHIRMSEFIS